MPCKAARLRRCVAILAAVLVLLGLTSPIVAASADEPWSGDITLVTSRAEVDAHNTNATLTAVVDPALNGPYKLSIYDDTGTLLFACGPYPYSSCEGGNTGHMNVSVPNNATHTYTAYVAQTAPAGPPGAPGDDLRATSNTVSVHNTGWDGTVSLATSRTEVDVHNTNATLTAVVDATLAGPYKLSIYDDTGTLLFACGPYPYSGCESDTTGHLAISVPNNATRTYVAYVAQTAPSGGAPTDDLRATSNTVNVRNLGWSGTVSLTASRTEVDVHNTTATLTAVADSILAGPYRLSIYDDTGELLFICGWSYTACETNTTGHVTVLVANNATRTYTAYVSQAGLVGGPPGASGDDLRATSNLVSLNNTGWTGTVSLATSRTEVDAHDTSAVLTAVVDPILAGPYRLSIYDDAGTLLFICGSIYTACETNTTGHLTVLVANNATRTYTAYVSQAGLVGGPPGAPADDLRATSNTVQVRNLGWNGSVSLTRSSVNPSTGMAVLTAKTAPDLAGPYFLSIYDSNGTAVFVCGGLVYTPCENNSTGHVTVPVTFDRTYTAYISQDFPTSGPPSNDVRAISGSYSSAGNGPTSAGEIAGSNLSEACSQRCQGDPVNTVTGDFWESDPDLAVAAGAGPDLGWVRSFATSRHDVDSSLGWGWSISYDMALSVPVGATGTELATASQLQVQQENGSVVVFSRMANGSYAAPPRVLATLQARDDGTFRFTRNARERYTFSAAGRLATLSDLNGNALDLSYDSGKLARVSRSSSQYLDVSWQGAHVSGVHDQTGRGVSYGYDTHGNLTTVIDVRGHDHTYSYDTAHRITAMTSPIGGVTHNTYDSMDRVLTQRDPLDRVTTFAYTDGQTTVTDPAGSVTIEHYTDGQATSETTSAGTVQEATTTYTYGPTNQVTSITDPLGHHSTFTYDARGNRLSETDPLGHTRTWTYDTLNNPTSSTDPLGHVSTMAYDTQGNLTAVVDAEGATIRVTLNADGTVASAVDPRGATAGADPADYTTTFGYDTAGNRSRITTPSGATITNGYDGLGRLTSTVDPRGNSSGADPADHTTAYTYNPAGDLLTVTDPLGHTSTNTYDYDGNQTSATDATGRVTTSTYDDANQVLQVADPGGFTTGYTYDDAGRLEQITDALGHATHVDYDATGEPTETTDPLGHSTQIAYDLDGQVTKTTEADGGVTTFTYDLAGHLATSTDSRGHITTLTYDAAGRQLTMTDPDNRVTTSAYDDTDRPTRMTRNDDSTLNWTYDSAGNLLAYTDAAGHDTTYTYNRDGRRSSVQDADARTTTYSYDTAGDLLTSNPSGAAGTDLSYDRAGRLATVDYPGATPDVSYGYDHAGRRTNMTDATGTSSYAYDLAGRLDTATNGHGDTVGYGYDAAGRVTDLTYPSGHTVTRGYDAADRLTDVTDWADRTTSFAWTVGDNLHSTTFPNGVTTTYGYNETDQPTSILTKHGTDTIADRTYAYDPAGLLTGDTTTGGADKTNSYDPLARIHTIETAASTDSTGFDAADNLTTMPGGITQTFDPAGQLTSRAEAAGTIDYFNDARGNRTTAILNSGDTTEQDRGYTYDAANQLTGYENPAGEQTDYTYDGTSLRASKHRTGDPVEHFTWDLSSGLPRLLADADHEYVYGGGSSPLAQIDTTTGDVTYLHTDQLGSVCVLTDGTGHEIADTSYSTFGTPTSSSVSAHTPFGYAGEYTDTETGLQYLRARYYDPTTGQFLTRDPLENQTRSAYGYAAGNPLQLTDPSGLWPSWGLVRDINRISSTVAAVAGTVAVAATVATAVCPVCAPITGPIAVATEALALGATVVAAVSGVALVSHDLATGCPWKKDALLTAAGVIPGVGNTAVRAVSRRLAGSAASARLRAVLMSDRGSFGGGLSRAERRKLGNLAGMKDEKLVDVIRSRGGGGSQLNQLQSGYGEKTLGELASLAQSGDAQAVKALKMAKESGSQGKGGK